MAPYASLLHPPSQWSPLRCRSCRCCACCCCRLPTVRGSGGGAACYIIFTQVALAEAARKSRLAAGLGSNRGAGSPRYCGGISGAFSRGTRPVAQAKRTSARPGRDTLGSRGATENGACHSLGAASDFPAYLMVFPRLLRASSAYFLSLSDQPRPIAQASLLVHRRQR